MKRLGLALAVFLAIGGVLVFGLREGPVEESADLGPLPDLSFQDYEGQTVRLADFRGKPLVVNAWATWCPFCIEELPAFAAVQRELGDQVRIVAVNRGESLSVAKEYTDRAGLTESLIFVRDPDDSFYRAIGGFSMPETIFVNSDGVIVEHKRGLLQEEEIREKAEALR